MTRIFGKNGKTLWTKYNLWKWYSLFYDEILDIHFGIGLTNRLTTSGLGLKQKIDKGSISGWGLKTSWKVFDPRQLLAVWTFVNQLILLVPRMQQEAVLEVMLKSRYSWIQFDKPLLKLYCAKFCAGYFRIKLKLSNKLSLSLG